MITVIVKRNDEPNVIQLTQFNVMNELKHLSNSEMLLEESWAEGLRRVRTPYVCLVEADCVLSKGYFLSNVTLMKQKTAPGTNSGKGMKWGGSHGGGGNARCVMLSSTLGVRNFNNAIYSYSLTNTQLGVQPNLDKQATDLYPAQVGFVPGAIIRMSSIKNDIDNLPWDDRDLVRMSTAISFHFWGSERRVEINPNMTYVSNQANLEYPKKFNFELSRKVTRTFSGENIS